MRMRTVNMWHIGNLLSQLMAVERREYERIASLTERDAAAFRDVFVLHTEPVYRRLHPHGQEMVRESLRYFLNARSKAAPLADMFAAMQDVPISVDDPYPVLHALWEALFPGQDFRVDDLSNYTEVNDDATGNEIYAPPGGWPERP
jgi:hypothetical protein